MKQRICQLDKEKILFSIAKKSPITKQKFESPSGIENFQQIDNKIANLATLRRTGPRAVGLRVPTRGLRAVVTSKIRLMNHQSSVCRLRHLRLDIFTGSIDMFLSSF